MLGLDANNVPRVCRIVVTDNTDGLIIAERTEYVMDSERDLKAKLITEAFAASNIYVTVTIEPK